MKVSRPTPVAADPQESADCTMLMRLNVISIYQAIRRVAELIRSALPTHKLVPITWPVLGFAAQGHVYIRYAFYAHCRSCILVLART
jgi:hypothetical protein